MMKMLSQWWNFDFSTEKAVSISHKKKNIGDLAAKNTWLDYLILFIFVRYHITYSQKCHDID